MFLCLVTLTFDPKINGFLGLMADHVFVKFGDSSCIDKKIDKTRKRRR